MISERLARGLGLSIRAALAAGLAVALAGAAGFQYPLYALIAAVIVTDLSRHETRRLALPRLQGTVVGAVVGAGIASLLRPTPWTVALGILVALFVCEAVRFEKSAKVAGYVSGIVILNYGDQPWSYAASRFGETVLGIGTAVLVSFVPRLYAPPSEQHEGAHREPPESGAGEPGPG